MRLKNIMIIVDDIEESVRFYKDLFGLQVILKQEGNVMMSAGLVLQDVNVWYDSTKIPTTPHNNMTELERGQKLVRFYDPSGNLIEVRTSINNYYLSEND